MKEQPIGIFDSGFGGISVLREAMRVLPKENFVYFSDNGNAPYGVRMEEDIRMLTLCATQKLEDLGAKAIVIACNTAFAASAEVLKAARSVPVMGVEPAILKAAETEGNGVVLMMATEATTRLPRYRALRGKLADP